MGIEDEYPMTDGETLQEALLSLRPNQMSLIAGTTNERSANSAMYGVCSSMSSASDGTLVNEALELISIFIC